MNMIAVAYKYLFRVKKKKNVNKINGKKSETVDA